MRSNSRQAWVLVSLVLLLVSLGLTLAQSSPPTPQLPPVQPTGRGPAATTRSVVVIDPAHGGSESGAVLNPTILEKDVTLALARRLRQDLTSRGILVEILREGDVNLSTDDRAAKANAENTALYLCLHASSDVGGIKVFSALLPQIEVGKGPFLDWNTAQSKSLENSRSVEQQLVTAIQKAGLRARSLIAPLRPLNTIAAPAIAIEVGPTAADVSQLMSNDYQQTISSAVANGVAGLSVLQANPGAPGSGAPK
jgi:N-acetylmuramoyl-L-alanine amidase